MICEWFVDVKEGLERRFDFSQWSNVRRMRPIFVLFISPISSPLVPGEMLVAGLFKGLSFLHSCH